MGSNSDETPNGYNVNSQNDENMTAPAPASSADQVDNDEVNMNEGKSDPQMSRMNEKGHFIKHKGISWPLCALFLIADLAGGGIVAIPLAVANTYFIPGVVFCLCIAAIATYTCILIGKCWVMLQQRYPEYRDFCRQVYAEIGYRAMGKWAKSFVSITIDVNQFGVSVIYLLLSAKSIYDAINALSDAESPLHYCVIILILALIMLPATFMKSPEEFWWTIFGAMACSVLSVVLIIIGSGLDYGACKLSVDDMFKHFSTITPIGTISGMGTIVFAFGGHSSFPVILHDMKRPSDFTKSSYMAFAGITALYIPMSIFGYMTYGSNIHSSIINSVQTLWIQQAINLMIMFHCILAFLLVLNPLSLDIEERLNASHSFGWQRVVIRSTILMAVTLFALTIPNFGPILDLVGASATLLTVLIFPVIFYFYLTAAGNMREERMAKSPVKTTDKKMVKSLSKKTDIETTDEYPRPSFMEMLKYNNKRHLVFGFAVMLLGFIICGCSSTTAIIDLSKVSFEMPCYVRPFLQHADVYKKPTFCCSLYGNVSAVNKSCEYSKIYSALTKNHTA